MSGIKKVIEAIEVIRVIKIIGRKSLITLITSITLITFSTDAQNINSPYSRYGIGDLQFSGFARDLGMGGLGIAVASPYNLNFTNPASYASLSLTTFEGGLRGNETWLESPEGTSSSGSTTFGYFAFGFPIKAGKWGLSFGLLPYSSVGYNITDVETNADPGSVTYTYSGNGGINQFYMGTGYSVFKNLRVGVNASYLFGTINQVRTDVFPDNLNYFNTQITDQTTVNDVYFNFGVQWTLDSLKISHTDSIRSILKRKALLNKEIDHLKDSLVGYQKRLISTKDTGNVKAAIASAKDSIASLKKQINEQDEIKKHVLHRRVKGDWSLNFGSTFALTSNIRASKTSLTQTFIYDASGFMVAKDTAQNIQGENGFIRLPLSLGFGIAIKKGTKWLFGADVSTQDWTQYRSFGLSDSLVASMRFVVGAQYTPDDRSIRTYHDLIQYRLGFHYDQTYLQLKNTDLNDYGISFGVGLPIRKALSVLQLSFELGKMGTLVNQLVEVNYFRFTVGLTLNDLWFIKPRID